MGGVFSSPPSTGENSDVLNNILNQMFSKADFVDLYSLADPNKCKSYVIVGANYLEKMFLKLRIFPAKKDDGTLYFQKIDSLVRLPADMKAVQQTHCKELAFFFIRVFQIFGALFLSMYDSEFPKVDMEDTQVDGIAIDRRRPFMKAADIFGKVADSSPKSEGLFGGPPAAQSNSPLSWLGLGGQPSSSTSSTATITPTNSDTTSDATTSTHVPAVPAVSAGKARVAAARAAAALDAIPIAPVVNANHANPAPFAPLAFTTLSIDPILQQLTLLLNKTLRVGGNRDYYTIIPDSIKIPKSSLPEHLAITDTKIVIPDIIYELSERPLDREYSKTIKYILTAYLTIAYYNTDGNKIIFKISLSNFNWYPQPPNKSSQNIKVRSRYIYWNGTYFIEFDINPVKPFSSVMRDMFREAENQGNIITNSSTARYLANWGYLANAYSQQKIRGTDVYIKDGQESSADAEIRWRTPKVKDKIFDIVATLRINQEKITEGKIIFYLVSITIKKTSREMDEILDIPDGTQSMQFKQEIKDNPPVSSSGSGKIIPNFIESVFKDLIPGLEKHGSADYTYKQRLGMYEPYDSAAIPEGFRIQSMWKAMVQTPPIKAHCIARASQLLSTQALLGNFTGAAYSSVCRLKFYYQQNRSLPKPNESITTSAGIAALATLFINTLENNSPKLAADASKWNNFKQQMKALFQLSRVSIANPESMPLSSIKQETFAMCDKTDQKIQLSRGLAQNLKGVTQNLLNQQRAHVHRAFNIIFQLFDRDALQSGKKLVFEKQLYTQGMARVAEISNSAIELLTEYYKGCETTYQQGVNMIYKKHLSNTLSTQ